MSLHLEKCLPVTLSVLLGTTAVDIQRFENLLLKYWRRAHTQSSVAMSTTIYVDQSTLMALCSERKLCLSENFV